jgi:hypothetical protein
MRERSETERKRASSPLCAIVIFALTLGLRIEAQKVITSQYDNARTGANLHETRLTPRNVNAQEFGKLFTLHVDGEVYAQPLFCNGVEIPGKGRHDVLFVVTEHDSVYAFDAYRDGPPLWQVSFVKDGETAVPADDVQCPFIAPDVGITSTPVIDPDSGTLYVLARTRGPRVLLAPAYYQRLHALAITTGEEKFSGPVEIQASMSGSGRGSSNGKLVFNPLRDNPRAAMLLNNGVVYLTWASSCDVGPYHGWVMAYAIVSATGAQDGVVWLLQSKGWNSPDKSAVLYAYDANDVSHELYDSNQNVARDHAGVALRFNIPMAVNGHVYVGARQEVDVYGLLPASGAGK